MTALAQTINSIPRPGRIATDIGAIGTAMGSFFDIIQGPLAAIASGLSIIWLGLQIYSWLEARRRNRK